jgi:hypothetical protein
MKIDNFGCIHQFLSKESSLEVLNKTRGNVVALMFHIFHYFQPIHTKNHIQCFSHLVHHLGIICVTHKMVRWKFCLGLCEFNKYKHILAKLHFQKCETTLSCIKLTHINTLGHSFTPLRTYENI